jgi:hypothetical protein
VTLTRNAALFVSSVLALVACGRGAGPAPEAHPPGPPVCDTRFAPPDGFEPTETFKEEYPDRIGVRLGYADGAGRELHAFAGIPGEFGEGLPEAGTVRLAGGRNGQLTGGPNDVWVVSWEEDGPCDPRAVLGSGFDRRTFLATLERSGLVVS